MKLKPEDRVKHISITVKRLTELSSIKYKDLKKSVELAAREYGVHSTELKMELDEPEIDW